MTVDEFLVWSEDQPGRYELIDGLPVRMQAERVRHLVIKLSVARALGDAVKSAKLACRALPDGATIRIDKEISYQPDAVVTCSGSIDFDSIEVTDPMIVVEVLSPSNSTVDRAGKLAGYAKVSSIRHYLIVDPVRRSVIHHKFGDTDVIETRILHSGELQLDPPGLAVPVLAFFEDLPAAGKS